MQPGPSTTLQAASSAAILAERVTKRFDGLTAVDDVSFAIPSGQSVGMIGPNGAGKTTMFSLLAGEIAPSAGRILFAGRRVDGLAAHEIHGLGLVRTFQIPRPFRRLTVEENLLVARPRQAGDHFLSALLARPRLHREEARARERARAILAELGLAAHAALPAGMLSGGQHKLLELGRALMAEPNAILLDEPCAGVSPAMIGKLSEAVAYLQGLGMTLVIVEHNIDFVMAHCERVIVMTQGRVMLDGVPEAVCGDERVLDAFLGPAASLAGGVARHG